MGGALGPLLARASLPVKEWGSDPDEKQDKLLRTEALAIGVLLLVVYILIGIEAIPAAYRWLMSMLGGAG